MKKLTATALALGFTGFTLINFAEANWFSNIENPGLPTAFDTTASSIINWLIGLVVILSVLALIWGGLRYVGSAGSVDETEGAKRTLKYAIIGLVVAGIAYAFVNEAIRTLGGTGGGG